MKDLSTGERQVIEAIKSAVLTHNPDPRDFLEIQSKFSELLKTNFENRNIWLRFGLIISLSKCSPHSALQAYNECMRIDQDDPLPAMLAAKLLLDDLDQPERALEVVDESIERCKRLTALADSGDQKATTRDTRLASKTKSSEDVGPNYRDSLTNSTPNYPGESSSNSSQSSISPNSKRQLTDKVQQTQHNQQASNGTPGWRYKDINPLLSKCYLLASIMHAQIYEREPESIKQFKTEHLDESLRLLDLAIESNRDDHLAYFHKALHQVKQRHYKKAIDNLRRAIQISPRHIPSMQLLILTLSALNLNEEALVLCESTLHEYEDNLLLLYFKCNLEQRLVSTKGYKIALNTAQYMLRSLRRSNGARDRNNNNSDSNRNHSSTTTISVANQSLQNQHSNQQQYQLPSNQQNNLNPQLQQHQTQSQNNQQQQGQLQQSKSGGTANSNNSHNIAQAAATVSPNTTPVFSPLAKLGIVDPKQVNNLFADDATESSIQWSNAMSCELSIWLLVAEIFVKLGFIEDAEMCIDEASIYATGALSHKVMFVRGLIAKARSNLIEAKTFFQSCLALCPRHAMALQQVAHVYYQMGHHSMAEKFLKDSLDLDGDCFKTWHYMSLVMTELNQHERADECAKKSTLLEESSPVVAFSTIPRLTLQ